LEIFPNGSISLASTNSGGVVILSGQAATDARSIAFPNASGNLALVASTTGAIASSDISDATSNGNANKEKVLKTDSQGSLTVTNSFGVNASFGSSLTVGDGDSVKGRYDIFANTSHFQWYSASVLYGEREFVITTENLTSSGSWAYKYPAASGTFALTASTTGVPDKLTDGTIAGTTTFNSTIYTYGTGAAAAHRTALGLTTLATTTPAANVATFLETPSSANLAAAVTDETGSGSLVFGTSPTLTVPAIRQNNASFTPLALGTYVATFADNTDAVSGVQMGNISTGTSADFRFLIKDTTSHYFAFAQPSVNNSFTLFGVTRSTADFIFNSGGTTRDIIIGTADAKYLALGTNNIQRVRITSSGEVGIGTTTPTATLDVNSNTVRVRTARTPASASATGNAGDICWDANYIYVCTATNTWKRTLIATWL
jgi:hypothetical protein